MIYTNVNIAKDILLLLIYLVFALEAVRSNILISLYQALIK